MYKSEDPTKRVDRILRYLYPSWRDHDDLRQFILLRSIEESIYPNLTFIYIKNRAIDYFRRQKKTIELLKNEDIEEAPCKTENIDLLNSLFASAQLNALEKEILWLHYYQSLNIKEIADRINDSKTSVKATLRSSIHKLRLALYLQDTKDVDG